jgi:hypothetical protein
MRIAVNDAGEAVATWTIWLGYDDGFGGVFAARSTAASSAWGAPTKLTNHPADSAEIAIDNFGNAISVWTHGNVVGAARYEVPTGWSTMTIEHSPCFCPTTRPDVAMDAGGNALLVWASANPPNQPVKVVRYVAATRSWTSPVTVSVATPWHEWMWPKVAMDNAGNAMVMWIRDVGSTRTPQATRYDAGSGTWSTPKDFSVSQKVHYSPPPVLGVDDEGNFVAVWSEYDRNKIKSATYTRATDSWGPVTNVADVVAVGSAEPYLATDPAGNSTVLWSLWEPNGPPTVFSTRRTAAGTWSPVSGPFPVLLEDLAVDRVGNAMVVFAPWQAGGFHSYSTRWLATPAAPTITTVTPGNSSLTVAFEAPVAEPGFANTNYEYSSDDGATWSTRSPASTASPVMINGLENGKTYAVRLRGVNHAGAGLASGSVTDTPIDPLPSAPTGLLGLADGSTVSLTWQNTFGGGTPSGIVIDVTGDAIGSIPLPLTDRFTTPHVPPGTYTAVVRAVNASGSSAPSNAVTLTFPGVCSAPNTPTNFSASRSGDTIIVSWLPPAGGTAPERYTVLVTGSFQGAFPTTGLTLSGAAPSGTYSLSVAAANTCGTSAPTPSQTIVIP